jgi:hypothetical protein
VFLNKLSMVDGNKSFHDTVEAVRREILK